MRSSLVVLGESDPALRQLMAGILRGVGHDVRECSNALQLQVELNLEGAVASDRLLIVVNRTMADQCVRDLASAIRHRSGAGRERARVLYTCEMGHLNVPLPEIGFVHDLGVLEKPFDIDVLERVAQRDLVAEPAPEVAVARRDHPI
jgi:hypothetical protein